MTVLETHSPQLFQTAVKEAAARLRAGEVVALPTETVYGLAANAFDDSAVAKIFAIKGRPTHNPIIVHIAGLEMASQCVAGWPKLGDKLARSFWPGPLTLVLPRSERIPLIVTAGGATVGVRWPSHPFMQAVIRECGFPLAAPSANPSNEISPTTATHVLKGLANQVSLIVDGGQCQVGIESTVLDLTVRPPRVLRPGIIHDEALLAVTGELSPRDGEPPGIVKSPGMLRKHYAPKARLLVLSWRDERDLRAKLEQRSESLSTTCVIAHTRIPSAEGFARVSVIPHDPEAYARALYAELHQCDETGAQAIIVESVPETPEWIAVADRLKRASAL